MSQHECSTVAQVKRSELQPEVDKLLQCYHTHEANQLAAFEQLSQMQPSVALVLRSLQHHVRFFSVCVCGF